MEYLQGFIIGLILSNVICYTIYSYSVSELTDEYNKLTRILRRTIDEHNKQ